MKHGLNVGQLADNLYADSIGIVRSALDRIPGARLATGPIADAMEHFNNYVFQKMTRSAMLETALKFAERNRARMKGATDAEIYREAALETNELFGNMGRQGLFQSRTMQDLMRLCFFAPSWMEGTIRSEVRAYGQAGKMPINLLRRGALGQSNLAATFGKSLVGLMVLSQVVNLATKGQPTWKNEDGHKLDAWVPGGKDGFWFSPFSALAKVSEAVRRYYDKQQPGRSMDSKSEAAWDAFEQILANKLSAPFRAAKTMLTGRDYFGRPLTGLSHRAIEAARSVAPIPIPLNPVLASDPGGLPRITLGGNAPGAWQRQIAASLGVHLIPVQGPEAKMYAAAKDFRPDKATHDPSEYIGLRRALDAGDRDRAAVELRSLVADGGKKIPAIDKEMGFDRDGSWQPPMYTGKDKETEQLFLGSLPPSLREVYPLAIARARDRAMAYQRVKQTVLADLIRSQLKAEGARRQQLNDAARALAGQE